MKRASGRQITKSDCQEEDEEQDAGNFSKAAPAELAGRRIRRIKRGPTSTGPGPNPFAGVALIPQKNSQQETHSSKEDTHVNNTNESAGAATVGSSEQAQAPPDTSASAQKECEAKEQSTPVPVTASASGFAGFAGAGSPFKQLSQDSGGTEMVSPAVQCSQDSVATPVTTRPTVTPCPSAPLRGSSARAMQFSPHEAKNGGDLAQQPLSGGSAFKRLADGPSVFTAPNTTFGSFGGSGVFGNGAGNGSGAINDTQSWHSSDFKAGSSGAMQGGAAISLPQTNTEGLSEVTKVTGEEGEETVFSHEATLFAMEDGRWKHRGKGDLRINVRKDVGTARMLLRQKATLRLFLNAGIYKTMKMSRMGTDSVTFSCVNGAEEGVGGGSMPPTGLPKVYAIRFPVKGEAASILVSQFEKLIQDFQNVTK